MIQPLIERTECLDHIIFMGQCSLRRAVGEYMAHYRGERNHQGLENRLSKPIDQVRGPNGIIKTRERLGGMLSYYYRLAA